MKLIVTISGMLLAAGIAIAILGLPEPSTDAVPARKRLEPIARLLGLTQGGRLARSRRALIISAVLGLAIGLLTGWYILVVLAPALVVGLPALLKPPAKSADMSRLTDLENWVRGLAGLMTGGGIGLEQALRASLHSAPASIKPALARAVARLDAQIPTNEVLHAWADEMDDYSADLVAAALILEAERRGAGVTKALEELSRAIAAQAATRRRIEADRSAPRTTARVVSLITIGVLVVLALTTDKLDAYRTPVGQLIALVLVAAFGGCLLWMRKIAMGAPIPRFLSDGQAATSSMAGGQR